VPAGQNRRRDAGDQSGRAFRGRTGRGFLWGGNCPERLAGGRRYPEYAAGGGSVGAAVAEAEKPLVDAAGIGGGFRELYFVPDKIHRDSNDRNREG